MLADPERGFGLPARTAASHLNRPERERGCVLPSVVRNIAWLDDPRLAAALGRSDFRLADLKARPKTVYLALPPDRLRVCLGFMRGFIGQALDGIIVNPARSKHRVRFYLDEFGQLGRMDRLADGIRLLRGYGAQLWVFVQDLSHLKAVYPRWQSFLANTSQQFFGTADHDTARYLCSALGQQTIRFETEGSSDSSSGIGKPGSMSTSMANISRAARCSPRTRSCASVPRTPSSWSPANRPDCSTGSATLPIPLTPDGSILRAAE